MQIIKTKKQKLLRLIMITNRDFLGRIAKGNNLSHGLSNEPIYDCWVAMKARCNNPKHPMYQYYGGRGIKVCDRWINSFDNFLEDMGMKQNQELTLDRIDVNGNYEPDNCRWTTIQEQQKNRRNNKKVPGIEYESSRNKYRALITYKNKKYFLGRFDKYSDAVKARLKAEGNLWHTAKQ